MKTIGLLGGMSWESTVTYYQIINEAVKESMGGFHSAKCVLYSVDFHEIERCQSCGEWERSGEILTEAALNLEKAGADFLLICTNTMHKVVPYMEERISIPIVHIADVIADALKEKGIKRAALLGTAYTMEQAFYRERLEQAGLEVLTPDEEQRRRINDIIFQELCLGKILESSKQEYLQIIEDLGRRGAQGVILGCTEIGLLVQQKDTGLPLFDSTVLHGKWAVKLALEQ